MDELIMMIVLAITYFVWGFYVVLFPTKFKDSIEKSSRNRIRMLGFCIIVPSFISFTWIYIMILLGNLMEELYR